MGNAKTQLATNQPDLSDYSAINLHVGSFRQQRQFQH
jgi:hypothetical protein